MTKKIDHFCEKNASEHLEVVIVETREADCIFRSAVRGDGVMEVTVIIAMGWDSHGGKNRTKNEHKVVDDDYTSIMAGLCCGVPSVQESTNRLYHHHYQHHTQMIMFYSV